MKFDVIHNRMDVIDPLIEGKTVLDLGCIDHDLKQIEGPWLHRELVHRAQEVIGVDHLPQAVEALTRMGYKAVCQNVEELNLGRLFNVIVAGEIIEHLNNPGLFLEGVHRHLKDDGQFILSTPNPFSIAQFFRIFKRNRIKVNSDHTTWFDPVTLEVLLKRHGFTIKRIYWLHDFKRFHLRTFFAYLRPYFHDGFLVICRKTTS